LDRVPLRADEREHERAAASVLSEGHRPVEVVQRGPRSRRPRGQQPATQDPWLAQYTSFRFTTHLLDAGIDASIGSVGDALDNALMESTIGLYKTELIKPRRPWRSLAQVELATAEWVDWYNNKRLHSAIGHVPPTEYESMFYAQPQPREVVGVNS
jgi:putative transposase